MKAAQVSRRGLRAAIALALAGTAGVGAPVAFAADAQVQGGLEEVTVTATRRAETNLQETPISVSAVTSNDIERMVAKDISGIAASVPGFSAARVTAFNAASFAMRGVGITDIIVYQDSPVGVQVDDFVMPSVQTQLLDTFDIESVEVLRGPQGTLFGKNTTGGAVNIRTKRPDMQQFGADVRIGAAKFGEVSGQVALDVPVVSDVFALRFAGSYVKSDGYYKLGACWGPINTLAGNIPGITGTRGCGTGEESGGQDVFSGRLKAQWNVNDNITALLQYEVMRDRSDAVPAFNDTPPGGPYLWNALGFTKPSGDPLDNMGSTQRNDLLLAMGEGQILNVDGAYLNVDWQLSDQYTIYSNTGFRHQEEQLPNTYTGVAPINTVTGRPLSLFDASRDTVRDTFQQEVRLASSLDGPINYVVGGFYQRNDAKFCVIQALGFVDLTIPSGAIFGDPQFFNNNPQLGCNRQKSDSIAGFVDGTWEVTEKFTLGAGFRYTRDTKEWSGRTQIFVSGLSGNPAAPTTIGQLGEVINGADFARFPGGQIVNSKSPGFGNLKTTWNEPSWRVTGSYRFADDLFSYLTISRGYKAGGYNDQTGTSGLLVPELTRPVDPEFATNYEIGFKTEWADGRIRFNPTFFYVKYDDAQRAANVIAAQNGAQFQETVFFNAAKVTTKGAELEFQALVTDNFRVRSALAYLDAKYDEFRIRQAQIGNPTAPNGNGIFAVDLNLTGLPVPRSPEKSGSLQGIYTFDLGATGTLELTGELYYEDENLYYISAAPPPAGFTNANSPFNANLDQKTLYNASLAWTSADGQYFARLYGRNLSDKRYRIASQSVATLWTHTQWGEPRNFGIQVGAKFGGAAD
ncbi:MAG: TonB-dependent receptor [Steroidobacteraceae bacterium]|jgi:iron complex outermembrane receptor protein|nr:TonB-dependent receptor [Steroidobacteraceae bacterium]